MSLNYSPEAYNCISYFDKSAKEIRVEVEGIEDIPFWDLLFCNINTRGYKIFCTHQGGCKEIIKHIKDANKEQTFIAVLDSEYDEIISDKIAYKNPLNIFTLRHSTENYLFCPNSLSLLIRKLKRNTEKDYNNDCSEFQSEISKRLEPLLYYDCKKEENASIFAENLKIMGRESNVSSFTINNSYLPEVEKINLFIRKHKLNEIDIENIKEKFKDKNLFNFINGHFITYSIFTFVNSRTGKKPVSLGKNNLYAFLYDYCPNCKTKCNDYCNLLKQAQEALDTLISIMEKN